jgi:hypothetical protein
MKNDFFVSFVLLLILLFLLLSLIAQATEYKEVKAEDIQRQIENGKDVNLKKCRVVGELNFSEIKLKKFLIQIFIKSLITVTS